MSGARPAPRGAVALLWDRSFGPFFVGKFLSSCGIWIQNVAAAVLMFDLTRSPFMVGTVSVVQFLGPLVLSLWTGMLTDRFDRRRLLMSGRLLSGLSVAVLAVLLFAFGTGAFGGPPVLLAAVLVMGIGLAVSSPAMHALVPGLVQDQDLEQALALNAAAPGLARTVGPPLGAGALLLGGPAFAFAAAALCHWCYVIALVFVRARRRPRPPSRPPLFGGLRYLVEDRKAGVLMLGVAAVGFGADPVLTLTPSIADNLGGRSGIVGLLAAAFGAGSIVAALLFRWIRRWTDLRMVGIFGFCTLAAGLALTAVSTTVVLAATGFALCGVGFMLSVVALDTRIQRRVPDELRGRVMALWTVAFLGSRPFAAAVNGSIAELVSVRAALLTAAALALASSLLASVRYGYPPGGGPPAAAPATPRRRRWRRRSQ